VMPAGVSMEEMAVGASCGIRLCGGRRHALSARKIAVADQPRMAETEASCSVLTKLRLEMIVAISGWKFPFPEESTQDPADSFVFDLR